MPWPLQTDCASTASSGNSSLESGGAVSPTGRASSSCAQHPLAMLFVPSYLIHFCQDSMHDYGPQSNAIPFHCLADAGL